MLKKEVKYQVIEDSLGGLYLFVYDENDIISFAKGGYQFNIGSLKSDIKILEKDGNADNLIDVDDNPQALYFSFTEQRYKNGEWNTIADNTEIYYDRMGIPAKIEFDVALDVE